MILSSQHTRTLRTESSSETEEEEDISEAEAGETQARRVIAFATLKTIELLCHSSIRFVNGIFQTSPSIFTQIFTIMGATATCWEGRSGGDTPRSLFTVEEAGVTLCRSARNCGPSCKPGPGT